MANVSHIKLPGGTVLDLPSGGGGGTKTIWSANCDTARNTQIKVVTTSTGDFAKVEGNMIQIYFTNDNTTTSPKLNVDGLGAIPLYWGNDKNDGWRYLSNIWQNESIVTVMYTKKIGTTAETEMFRLVNMQMATTSNYGLTKLSNAFANSLITAPTMSLVNGMNTRLNSKSTVVANDTTGISGGSLSSIKIDGTSYTVSGGSGGGAGLNIPLDYSYNALVALSGDTVYLTSGTIISRSNIESILLAGGSINFTFNKYGTFDGEAALISYDNYSDSFGTYQRGLAVLTDGSSAKTFVVDFNWDYQDNLQTLVFTALSSGGGNAFGITTPVAYIDYYDGNVQNTTAVSGLSILVGNTNPISAGNFVLECSSGNAVSISAMAYAIIDGYSNRYSSFDAYIQSSPQVNDQCSLVVWYLTRRDAIWKTTIPLIVNDVTSSSIELFGDQQGLPSSVQANFIGD